MVAISEPSRPLRHDEEPLGEGRQCKRAGRVDDPRIVVRNKGQMQQAPDPAAMIA